MKKLFLCLIAALLVCGCASTKSESATEESTESSEETEVVETPGVANPMTEYDTLDEINAECGTYMVPFTFDSITEENYFVYDCGDYKIAEYNCFANDTEYTLRAVSNTTEDISGLYDGGNQLFPEVKEGIDYEGYSGCLAARWFTLDGQYVLSVVNEGDAISEEEFHALAEATKEANTLSSNGDGLVDGEYYDSVSQRATMTATTNDDGTTSIEVSWSSSATETTKWTLTATQNEDKLEYTDCQRVEVSGDTETVAYENGTGYFTIEEGKLKWDGSSDETTVGCVFEKAED